MNIYVGKTCPFCKTDFKEDDNIVVCSSCDMPHHKECWIENQGCTTFGCMGTIKMVDTSTTTVTATEISYEDTASVANVYCTKCGAPNSSTHSFCSKCGNYLKIALFNETYTSKNFENNNQYAYTQQSYNSQPIYTPSYQQNNYYTQNDYYAQPNNQYSHNNDINDGYVSALVGVKQEYYIPHFQQLKLQNKKTSWNWSAFLFSPFWFIYRKMYTYGIINLCIAFLVSFISDFMLISLLSLVSYIAIGIFANSIYMQWVENKANQAKAMNTLTDSQFIQTNGGVNSTALLTAVLVVALLCILKVCLI